MSGPQPPDDVFLRLLDPDPDQAAARYAELFAKLVRYFEWRHCRLPEDLAQETLMRGFLNVANGANIYVEAERYFYGIARHVLMETWDENRRRMEPLDLVAEPATSNPVAANDSAIFLREILALLPADERDLVSQYYTQDRKQLCRQLQLSPEALRVRVFRIREKLRRQMSQWDTK